MDSLQKSLLATALIQQRTALANQVDIVSKLLESFPLPEEEKNTALKAELAKLTAIANKFIKYAAERVYSDASALTENGVFSENLASHGLAATVAFTNRQLGDLEMTLVPAWKRQVIDPEVEVVRHEYKHLPQPDKSVTFDVHGFLHYQGAVLLGMLQSFAYIMRAAKRLDIDSIREQLRQQPPQ